MSGYACYVVEAPRSSELVAWLGFNGVPSGDVPYPATIHVETADGVDWFIRYSGYARSVTGNLLYDMATDTFLHAERRVPMVYDPPMWWLKDAAPNGGDGTASGGDPQGETLPDRACNCD